MTTSKDSLWHAPLRELLSLGCAAAFGLALTHAAVAADSVSEQRVERLREHIREYFDKQGRSVSDLRVTRETLTRFKEQDDCSALPIVAVVTDADYTQTAARMTRELVREKYPDPDPETVAEAAAAKYPISEEGETITVTYQASPAMSRTHSGIYRGRSGQAIVVGPKRILLRDIVAAARDDESVVLKFDKGTSTQLRKELIAAKLERYAASKKAFERSVRAIALKEARKRATAKNEKSGYILYTGEWRSLRDTTKLLIREERERDAGE